MTMETIKQHEQEAGAMTRRELKAKMREYLESYIEWSLGEDPTADLPQEFVEDGFIQAHGIDPDEAYPGLWDEVIKEMGLTTYDGQTDWGAEYKFINLDPIRKQEA